MTFEKYEVVVFSTGHIQEHDTHLLDSGNTCVVAYPYEYGYFVHLSEEVTEDALARDGFSFSFIRVYVDAREAGAKYLQLDRDGAEYDDYRKFDW